MISSTANQQVKEVQKLQKSHKYRSEKGLFLVEGWRMISEIPTEFLEAVYVMENEADKAAASLAHSAGSITTVSKNVMKAMSNEVTPQGVLALVRMKNVTSSPLTVDNPLIIALDCVQDPGNLGTIIRTAEAAGVHRILLSKGTVDLYNPKVVKSTMGAIFRMDIQRDVNLEEALPRLKEQDIAVYAAHLKGEMSHYDCNFKMGTCFLMGNEGNGLRKEIAALASEYMIIPMKAEAESLNVAMATGILIYEAIRQRR